MSFRRRRNPRKKLDKDRLLGTELLAGIPILRNDKLQENLSIISIFIK
jgi:hypothetical protein